MKVLAIDYGSKNIGLALVDTALGVVLPFGRIEWSGERDTRNGLVNIIRKEKIDKIVAGLPIGIDGKENENTKKIRKFVSELKNETDTPVDFIDERFTSAQADRMGGGAGGASRDEKAAMILLQSYLDGT